MAILKKEIDGRYILLNDKRQIMSAALSQKNCQAIERGYDLDELANERSQLLSLNSMFKAGFQKALELMGDKKYSEEDVLDIVFSVINELVLIEGFDKKYLFPETIYQEITTKCKSLKQTEWDVEVEMEEESDTMVDDVKTFLEKLKDRPKRDDDGCIILKRK